MGKGKLLLTGAPKASIPKTVVGTIRVALEEDLDKMAKIKPGEILVSERFNPVHNKYIKQALAIITDVGGRTSHGPMVAREYGIPAVTGTGKGTYTLQDGQKVVLDGAEGMVYEYLPEQGEEYTPPTATVAKPISLADKMAALAAKKGIPLKADFLEQMRKRE